MENKKSNYYSRNQERMKVYNLNIYRAKRDEILEKSKQKYKNNKETLSKSIYGNVMMLDNEKMAKFIEKIVLKHPNSASEIYKDVVEIKITEL